MKLLLLAALWLPLFGQTATISDTIPVPIGSGAWAGTVTVTINNPQSSQPLYSGSTPLAGWSYRALLGRERIGMLGKDCGRRVHADALHEFGNHANRHQLQRLLEAEERDGIQRNLAGVGREHLADADPLDDHADSTNHVATFPTPGWRSIRWPSAYL